MNARFRSLAPSSVDYWYDDGGEGVYQGTLTMGKEASINTYEGHVFYFTESNNKQREVVRFVMDKDKVMYAVYDPLHPAPKDLDDQVAKHEAFDREYYNRTGLHWRHYYGPDGPRPPPSLYMWPAATVGQLHTVSSSEGLWSCGGSKENCQSPQPLDMTLEVVSLAPRVFIIPNFLSDFEAEQIIHIAQPKIKESTVGQAEAGGIRKSGTRTSMNTYVHSLLPHSLTSQPCPSPTPSYRFYFSTEVFVSIHTVLFTVFDLPLSPSDHCTSLVPFLCVSCLPHPSVLY